MKKNCIIGVILILFLTNVISVYFLFNKKSSNTYEKEATDNFSYQEQMPIKNWKEYNLVLHAGGGLHGNTHTNTKEALIETYWLGNKVIELDFLLTSDNKLVASHDYDRLSIIVGNKIDENSTLAEILNESMNRHLTLLSFEDVVDLLIKFPDMYIITDTKNSEQKDVISAFTHIYMNAKEKDLAVLKRVIPQIYTADMYHYIEEIYKFDEYVWALYQVEEITTKEIVDTLENIHKIKAITMPIKPYKWQISTPEITSDFINEIKKRNVLFYVHTLNDTVEIDKFYKMGVWGFFTDYITESYLKRNELLQYKK